MILNTSLALLSTLHSNTFLNLSMVYSIDLLSIEFWELGLDATDLMYSVERNSNSRGKSLSSSPIINEISWVETGKYWSIF